MTSAAGPSPGRPRSRRTVRPSLALPARRWVAAGLAALVVGGGLHLVVSQPRPEDVAAVVAARALPVGAPLGEGDTELRHLPESALPAGALRELPAGDARAAVPLQAGEILSAADLRTSALLEGLPGRVAVFVPLGEAALAEAMGSGDVVDVHSPVEGSVVAREALVLQVRGGEAAGLWLAVEEDTAVGLAAARGADPVGAALSVALRPPPP
ncbi:SAF domain-containing protein [uncultured Serinicoccus sp.]|uniref:SAF domain-containing protein n=1 Tax=uncultured Serinicoccus sp. TaxID=735514 RepID=UPI0026263ED3|nr:SAF domain-containing protein [uncultured Serinicoccus sp.]